MAEHVCPNCNYRFERTIPPSQLEDPWIFKPKIVASVIGAYVAVAAAVVTFVIGWWFVALVLLVAGVGTIGSLTIRSLDPLVPKCPACRRRAFLWQYLRR